MNYSALPLAVMENVRTVAVKFFDNSLPVTKGREYTYLTTDEFAKGDLAVVFVNERPAVVEAQRMDVKINDNIEYKWIVAKVYTGRWLACVKVSLQLAETVRSRKDLQGLSLVEVAEKLREERE